MKRPLAMAAIGFAGGIFWVMHGGTVRISWMTLFLLTVIGVALGWKFHKVIPLCVATLSVLYGISYADWYVNTVQKPVSKLDGETQLVTARVLEYADVYEENQRVRIHIPKEQLQTPRDITTLIYLPLTEQELRPGDEIRVTAEFYLPTYSQGFDREQYYQSNGIFILGSAKNFQEKRNAEAVYDLKITPDVYSSVWDLPKKTAHQIRHQISAQFTERQGAFLTALLLGDRTELTNIDSNHLKKAGLSHVIAVSGLHVGFLIALLLFLFGRRIGSVLSVPMLLFFFLMVGWSPSVVRASIMYLFLIASFWFRRESDSLNALSAALLLILLYLPTAVDSVSLQLSFSATLGLILFAGRVNSALAAPKWISPAWAKRIWNWIAASISCTLCAQIFAIPILLYYFGYVSILSIPANLAVLWAVSAVFALGCAFAIACLLVPMIAQPLASVIGPLTDYIWLIADQIAGLPFGLLYSNRTLGIAAVIVLYITMLLLVLRILPKVTLPIGLIVIAALCRADWKQSLTETRIAFLSVGYGQAAVVSHGDECILIDCGGSGHYNAAQSVLEYMDWNGIEDIDRMILTSVDKTHARNAAELIESTPVSELILPAVNRSTDTLEQLQDIITQEKLPVLYYEDDAFCPVGNCGVSVLGGIERKLLVRIQAGKEDILIVHAATQNMLFDYLSEHTLSADRLVASAQITEDYGEMEQILGSIAPSEIVLGSGWESATKFAGIPVYNLYEHGDWFCTVSMESR